MRLFEMYQEERGSNFVHDGNTYDINKLFKLTDMIEPEQYRISDMIWILNYDVPEPSTYENININMPLLITMWFDGSVGAWRHVVIDGLHRLNKAREGGVSHLFCKMIPSEMMAKCLVP